MGAITIRLPDELHEQVEALAADEQRSLNGQIVWMLRQTLMRRKLGKP